MCDHCSPLIAIQSLDISVLPVVREAGATIVGELGTNEARPKLAMRKLLGRLPAESSSTEPVGADK